MSIQHDTAVPSEQSEEGSFFAEMEMRLAVSDAQFLQNTNTAGLKASCSYIIEQIEKKLMHSQLDKRSTARLTALEGRAYLLSGDRARAGICLEKAEKKNAEDSEVLILAYRLGRLKDLDAAVLRHDNDGLLILENAIESYEKGSYYDAAGSFDTAFLSLPPFYRHAYQALRDESWALKDTASEDVLFTKLLQLPQLSLLQMMEITRYSTGLLDVCTGGNKLTGRKLYTAVVKSGLLDSVSGSTASGSETLSPDTTASRILCARFLWNLKNSGGSGAEKYSRKYRSGLYAESPVADIPLNSPDFDAVLGTVENELLMLPDGRNFNPAGTVSGVEFNESVKKIK